MTFWLDANLDPDLAPWLGGRYKIVVKHVRELGLERSSDRELFDAARRLNATVVATKDADLVDLVTLLGKPPQILRLTCGNMPTPAMHVLLNQRFEDALRLLEAGEPWVEIG
jgi:predicted nuclease of predicted toxin-antitoxin system